MFFLEFFGATLMTAAIVFFLGSIFVDIPLFQKYKFIPYFVGALANVLFIHYIRLSNEGSIFIQFISMIILLGIGFVFLGEHLDK